MGFRETDARRALEQVRSRYGGTMTDLSPAKSAVLVKCLAVQEHPDFTEDHTMAIVARAPEKLRDALVELFGKYAGVSEGNGTGRKAANKIAA